MAAFRVGRPTCVTASGFRAPLIPRSQHSAPLAAAGISEIDDPIGTIGKAGNVIPCRTRFPFAGNKFRRATRSSFRLRPDPGLAVVVDFDVDYVWPATDRTILDVLLALARGHVERHDDLLAAAIADVVGFRLHARDYTVTTGTAESRVAL